MLRLVRRAVECGSLIIPFLAGAAPSLAQERATIADSLVATALAANPRLRAAESQVSAARARIGPAGAWPDPMLMAGIQNLPISRDPGPMAGPEPMTMKMVGASQTIPYPGKTSLRRSVARAEADAVEARLAAVRLTVSRDVVDAYYDLATARTVLALIERQQQVAASVLPAAEARYVAGTAAQSDVIKARTEAALLVEERNAAQQQERAALARLNAALDQASTTPIQTNPLADGSFTVTPLSLDSLHAIALRASPRLRERRAMITARTAQAELARREYLPDFDVSIQYGQRDRLPDMITATVGVPLPIQRGRKQSAEARAARFDLAAAEAELKAEENELRAEITRAHAEIERQRANADLLTRAILLQARATFASASASYQSGRGELLNVLDAMRAMFAAEAMYVRALAELAKAAAELQALVGEEPAQ
jgi:outer membrane protein TolC